MFCLKRDLRSWIAPPSLNSHQPFGLERQEGLALAPTVRHTCSGALLRRICWLRATDFQKVTIFLVTVSPALGLGLRNKFVQTFRSPALLERLTKRQRTVKRKTRPLNPDEI